MKDKNAAAWFIAILIIILGAAFLVNAIMCRVQPWERMKDFLCVQPALIFFRVEAPLNRVHAPNKS